MAERAAILRKAKSDYAKAHKDLCTLKAEVVKAISGESSFSSELLRAIKDGQKNGDELKLVYEAAQTEYDNDLLAQIVVIGNWAEFVYAQAGLLPGFEANLRTFDVDFLITNSAIDVAFVEKSKGWLIKIKDSNAVNSIFLFFKTITISIICIAEEIVGNSSFGRK